MTDSHNSPSTIVFNFYAKNWFHQSNNCICMAQTKAHCRYHKYNYLEALKLGTQKEMSLISCLIRNQLCCIILCHQLSFPSELTILLSRVRRQPDFVCWSVRAETVIHSGGFKMQNVKLVDFPLVSFRRYKTASCIHQFGVSLNKTFHQL
jgi:hypothetical protein